jgi:hypothetical protein
MEPEGVWSKTLVSKIEEQAQLIAHKIIPYVIVHQNGKVQSAATITPDGADLLLPAESAWTIL